MKLKLDIESFYETTLESLPLIVLAIDDNEKLQLYNRAATVMFNIPPKSYGRTFSEFYDGNELSDLLTEDAVCADKTINLSGRIFLCHSLRSKGKLFKGHIVIMTEITELENVRAKLTKSQALKDELNTILQASFDYIFVTDGEGNVLRINDSYTRITGVSRDEVLGKNIYDLVRQGYYDRAATIEVIESKKSITFTQTIKTGKMVLVTGNPVFDDEGKLVLVVTNGRDITELYNLKQQVEQARHLRLHYQRELQKIQYDAAGDYIAACPKMYEIADLIKRIARVDSTVLINGESGVGKEIVAREIHRNSMRSEKPYISINCAAIPDNLIESELFGYEAGAFTGAKKGGKMGIFQVANGGTLFLDEIGELPFYLQAKLLRVIQENEIMRVGGTTPIPIDVRIITATNRNLWQMVQERQFREDFYYRLNVVQIRIPPLRDRKEEIPVFVDYFLGMLNKKYKLQRKMDTLLLERLLEYRWPGNVRELKNAVEQAFVTSPGQIIQELNLGPQQDQVITAHSEPTPKIPTSFKEAMQEFECKLIKDAVEQFGSTRKAAAALGVSQATIWRKATQYGIDLVEN